MHDRCAERVPVAVLGDERQRRSDLEGGECPVGLRRVGDELAEKSKQVGGLVEFVEEDPDIDVVHRMQLELQRSRDTEVAAASPQPPEQVSVLILARSAVLTVGRDDVNREQVVQREAVPAGEVTDPAAEGQAGHTGRGHDPTRGGQPEGVRRVVEVSPCRTATGARRARLGIDVHGPHERQIDHHAVVVGAEAGRTVPAATHRQVQALIAGEVHRADHGVVEVSAQLGPPGVQGAAQPDTSPTRSPTNQRKLVRGQQRRAQPSERAASRSRLHGDADLAAKMQSRRHNSC
jgi:hypothetical protein